jgi:hypothetical protein
MTPHEEHVRSGTMGFHSEFGSSSDTEAALAISSLESVGHNLQFSQARGEDVMKSQEKSCEPEDFTREPDNSNRPLAQRAEEQTQWTPRVEPYITHLPSAI